MSINSTQKTNMITAASDMDTAIAALATAWTNFLTAQTAAMAASEFRDGDHGIIERSGSLMTIRRLIGGRFVSAGIKALIEGRTAANQSVDSIATVVTAMLG